MMNLTEIFTKPLTELSKLEEAVGFLIIISVIIIIGVIAEIIARWENKK